MISRRQYLIDANKNLAQIWKEYAHDAPANRVQHVINHLGNWINSLRPSDELTYDNLAPLLPEDDWLLQNFTRQILRIATLLPENAEAFYPREVVRWTTNRATPCPYIPLPEEQPEESIHAKEA